MDEVEFALKPPDAEDCSALAALAQSSLGMEQQAAPDVFPAKRKNRGDPPAWFAYTEPATKKDGSRHNEARTCKLCAEGKRCFGCEKYS